MKNIVYQCVCVDCDDVFKAGDKKVHKGRYIGETYRTLYERAGEHCAALENLDIKGFMFKHWALEHPDLETPPQI